VYSPKGGKRSGRKAYGRHPNKTPWGHWGLLSDPVSENLKRAGKRSQRVGCWATKSVGTTSSVTKIYFCRGRKKAGIAEKKKTKRYKGKEKREKMWGDSKLKRPALGILTSLKEKRRKANFFHFSQADRSVRGRRNRVTSKQNLKREMIQEARSSEPPGWQLPLNEDAAETKRRGSLVEAIVQSFTSERLNFIWLKKRICSPQNCVAQGRGGRKPRRSNDKLHRSGQMGVDSTLVDEAHQRRSRKRTAQNVS